MGLMSVLSLYPEPGAKRPLRGTYLSLKLHERASAGEVHVYGNFIVSLDGRISVWDSSLDDQQVPRSLANARDWRLYQELAAQSDIMLTSARFFRQLAAGCAQDLLPVADGHGYEDLREWRREHGLQAQPDVLILSASLDIPLQALPGDRRLWIVTGADAPEQRVRLLEHAGARVVRCSGPHVSGAEIRGLLEDQGYRSAYMIAGPQVHRTLLMDGAVDTLFLTHRFRLLGGSNFHTLLEGEIGSPRALQLCTLYLDCEPGFEQFYAQYRLSGAPR